MTKASLQNLLAGARRAVIFTGAGISTESGIPDFRSPGGVWTKMKPITFQEFVGNEDMQRETWRRRFAGDDRLTGSKPNSGHYAIASLVNSGKASSVITQNVDNLHQDSGVPGDKVIELHGNMSYARCLDCSTRHELEEFREAFLERGEIPLCRACGGLVKTAVISFGQQMPQAEMERAEQEALTCDLFLAIGSSLVVYPAAGLPVLAKENGARLVILNREPTPLDSFADLVINDEIGRVLPGVVDALLS